MSPRACPTTIRKLKRATHSIKRKQEKGAKQILRNQRVKRRYSRAESGNRKVAWDNTVWPP
jgi:hypothetical protein